MKWPLLLFVGWLAILPDPGIAAPPDPPERLSDPPLRPSLIRKSSAAHFQLVLGRLQLDPVRYRKGSQSLVHVAVPNASSSTTVINTAPVTETLHISSERGLPKLHYSAVSENYQLIIDAEAHGQWRLESRRDGMRVIVEQVPNEPIALNLQSDAPEKTVRVSTWLHLREAEREVFESHFESIVDEMLWPYRLRDLAEAAHSQSLQETHASPSGSVVITDSQIQIWIDDLRSDSRLNRVAADRNLRSVGISLVPRLATLDRTRLDAEQRMRLTDIQHSLTPRAEDDAARLANLIRDDRTYWQLASARLDWRDRVAVQARFKSLGLELPVLPRDDVMEVAVGEATMRR